MNKQRPVDVDWVRFHVREARKELEELEKWLEHLLTGKNPRCSYAV